MHSAVGEFLAHMINYTRTSPNWRSILCCLLLFIGALVAYPGVKVPIDMRSDPLGAADNTIYVPFSFQGVQSDNGLQLSWSQHSPYVVIMRARYHAVSNTFGPYECIAVCGGITTLLDTQNHRVERSQPVIYSIQPEILGSETVTFQAPTNVPVQVRYSSDLINWIDVKGYFYLVGKPISALVLSRDVHRFYTAELAYPIADYSYFIVGAKFENHDILNSINRIFPIPVTITNLPKFNYSHARYLQ